MSKLFSILFSPFKKWLSILDRYIIERFFISTLFAHLIIIAIAIVIDFSEKTEHFVERSTPTNEIFLYYLDFIPYISSILAPLLIFLAVTFFTSRMAYNSEIIAMLNSGINFRRFLKPFIISGFISVGILLYANHWLVPRANKEKLAFEDKYVHTPKTYGNNFHLRLNTNTFIAVERFKFDNNEGFNFSLERFEGTGADRKLTSKINANKLTYEENKFQNWKLHDYKKWEIDGMKEKYTEGKQMDTTLELAPDDFMIDIRIRDALDYKEMEQYINEEKVRGAGDIAYYRVEQYRRTSSAVSVLILVIMGAALGSKKIRGGNWLNIMLGIALSALYIFFLQFSSSFSTNGDLHPVIGTNIPNLLFAVISIFLVRYASR
jgi:lipopolysaccharide export system permease protein